MPKPEELSIRVIHLEKEISVQAAVCFSCFSAISKLRKWYDQKARMTSFRVGGKIAGDYFPGYQIVAIVKNQMLVQILVLLGFEWVPPIYCGWREISVEQ
jgi:hypothetical protein